MKHADGHLKVAYIVEYYADFMFWYVEKNWECHRGLNYRYHGIVWLSSSVVEVVDNIDCEVWCKVYSNKHAICIESDMVFSLSTHRCFVETENPSSTTRLYVDPDGQGNVNGVLKKILKME